MGWTSRLLAAIGFLSAAIPAAAQDQPARGPTESDSTIVVTGRSAEPPTRNEVYEQARDLSRVGRFQTYEEALPRFEGPLCPAVFGLRDDYAEEIVARVRSNAARLELPLAGERCTPNLMIAFIDDGRSYLGELEQKHPELFSLVADSEREELLGEPAPARAWNVIAKRWTGAGPPPANWPQAKPSVRGQLNRNFMPEAHDIVTSLVVFEREAIVGMTLTQLADYATMRGLSHTRAATGDEPMATILAMFEGGGEDIAELTSFDMGYLKSLYRSLPNLSAANRFAGIARRMREQGEGAAGR